MAAGSSADLALHFWAGEVFIVLYIGGIDRELVVNDHAGAGGETEPLAVGGAHVGGQALVQHFGLDRLEQAGLFGTPQAAGIHGDQHIGGRGGAFIDDACDQRIFAGFDPVQLDAGGFAKVAVQRLIRLVMT